jgi:putative ABC transport system ATP-binding protein
MIMIKLSDVRKIYRAEESSFYAINGINLTINTGEFVAITGLSGAGKSTLLYLMSLLDSPSGGRIEIDGQDVLQFSDDEKTSFRLKNFGYVFQDYALLPELTARENVMVPLIIRGVSEQKAAKKAGSVLDVLGLSEHADKVPSKLSGGQQQRVSIARALSNEPRIIFADEPTANLDSISSRDVLAAFRDLHRKGQTIVMITHEEIYAAMAERSIELKDGKIIKDSVKH